MQTMCITIGKEDWWATAEIQKQKKGSASVSVQYTANPVHSVPAISTSDAGQAATGVLQKTKKTFWRI